MLKHGGGYVYPTVHPYDCIPTPYTTNGYTPSIPHYVHPHAPFTLCTHTHTHTLPHTALDAHCLIGVYKYLMAEAMTYDLSFNIQPALVTWPNLMDTSAVKTNLSQKFTVSFFIITNTLTCIYTHPCQFGDFSYNLTCYHSCCLNQYD